MLLVLVLPLCAVMQADTIIVNVDFTRGWGTYTLTISDNGSAENLYFAGVLALTLAANGQTVSRDAICIDLYTDINVGTMYGTKVIRPDQDPDEQPKHLDRISWLVDNALPPIAGVSALDPGDIVQSQDQGAGLQLAVWDIRHNDGDGFSAGSIQADTNTDSNVLAWAEKYELLSVGKRSDHAFVYENWDLNSGTPAQELIGPRHDDPGPRPTPEPSTLALMLGVGLSAGGGLLRGKLARRSPSN